MTDAAPLSPVVGKPLPPRSPPLCLGWNLILSADFYKGGHHALLESRLEQVVHYLESRGGDFDKVVCAGASFVAKVLAEYTLTAAHIDEAEAVFSHTLTDIDIQLNRSRWVRLLEKHSGKLPLKIMAIPDGTVVPPLTPMLVVYNTDPEFPWLPGYIESWLLSVIWHQSTVATKSLAMKTIIKDAYAKTGEPFLGSPVVDFGVRGSAGGPMGGLHASAAALGGFAHLMVSEMSDNVPALHFAQAWGFRGPLNDDPLPPSILATEHSIMTSYGRDERKAFEILLSKAPDKPISIVMDAYDLFAAIDTLGRDFRDQILARPETAPVVIRPDSGDPLLILPKVLTMLADHFGTTETDGGYALLNPRVRVIQGDGISVEKLAGICDAVIDAKFALANLIFGSGGGLLQSATRDTLKFAYKASAGVIYDKSVVMMSKDPITDPGKKSKEGLLTVECHDGVFTTVVAKTLEDFTANQAKSFLKTYYEEGLLVSFDSLKEMRARVSQGETRWIGTEKAVDRKRKMPDSA
jgi:nicotinamide phosphoribosyltransferase